MDSDAVEGDSLDDEGVNPNFVFSVIVFLSCLFLMGESEVGIWRSR